MRADWTSRQTDDERLFFQEEKSTCINEGLSPSRALYKPTSLQAASVQSSLLTMPAREDSMIAYSIVPARPEWDGRGQGSAGDPVRLDKGTASSPV